MIFQEKEQSSTLQTFKIIIDMGEGMPNIKIVKLDEIKELFRSDYPTSCLVRKIQAQPTSLDINLLKEEAIKQTA